MIDPFSNPSYLLPPLAGLAITLALVVTIWRGVRPSFSTWIFCGFIVSIGLWDLVLFGMRSSPDLHRALLWERALIPAFFAAFILYYHFTLVYTNTQGQRGILLASYLCLILVTALAPTDLIIERMRLEYYGYAPVLGPISYLTSIGVLLLIGAGVRNLLKRYNTSPSYEERNRMLYLIIAVLLALSGALLDGFSNLPPVSVWSSMLFAIVCSVAILKYHLLDIRIVFKKALVYLLISSLVAIPYVGTLVLLNQILKARLELWIHALIILLLAVLLRPLYSWAQQLVDRLFYRDRYDYLRALQRFSQQAQSILNLEELSSTLTELVSGALHVPSVSLLLPSEGKVGLVLASSTGLESPPSEVVVRNNSLLVKWLKLQGDILSSEQLDIVPQLQALPLKEKNYLERIRAKLYVPIKTRQGQLSGILVLGQKLSQQSYSNEDKQLLKTLSSQMAVVLENAELYGEALRARQNLETGLNSMTDCVMIVNTDYTAQFMNKAAIEKFASRASEKCWKVLGKDTVCPSCPLKHYLRGNRDGLQYSENIRDREYDIAAAPLLNPDGSLSIIEVLRDITEQKQAEERERRLQEELHRSSRLASIGELAAGVAHEINSPLTGIMGFSQRLLRKSTDEGVKRDLGRIYNEALRSARVVENLLTFARRREPKREYSDINDIFQKALELRAYELKTSTIEVETDLAPGLLKTTVDFYQIEEVFLNIIMNAEQVMGEANRRGKLSVKTQEMKGYIRVSFTDDGPGIPAEHLNKVFDPFFTTRGEKGGTGLGLSICHGIVAEHGGRIYVKSKPGQGATFFVELPIVAEAADKNKLAKEDTIRGSHKYEPS